MNGLDLRTVLFSYVISNAICAFVLFSLWLRNRQRSPELGFWLANFMMQFVAVLLIVLRGLVPEYLSIILGTPLVIGGTLLLYIGLGRFMGKKEPQRINYALLAVFIFTHLYFTLAQNNLQARNINFSLALFVICSQCVWLMLRQANASWRSVGTMTGVVFLAYSLLSIFRIFIDIIVPPGNDFFKSDIYDTLVIMSYQMLSIALTFALFLMVNGRLFSELQEDVEKRKKVEDAFRKSEQKYSMAFNHIPDALVITLCNSGAIIEVNTSFFNISEYSKDEIIGKTTLDLNLWGKQDDRDHLLELLQKQGVVQDFETIFRKKSGELITGLISAIFIQLDEGICILNVIQNISERKQQEKRILEAQNDLRRLLTEAGLSRRVLLSVVEDQKKVDEALRKRTVFIESILQNAPIGFAVNRISDGEMTFISSRFEDIYGLAHNSFGSVEEFFNRTYLDPIFREEIRERVLSDINSGDPARMKWENVPIITQNGEKRVVSAINIPLLEQDLMISTVQDVTERWIAEEKITTLNADLEQRVRSRTAQLEYANQELEAFTYSVSHDLRAPLRGIDGWSQILQDEYHDQLDEGGRESLNFIRSETKRMGLLIESLLQLSRISRTEMKFEQVDCTRLAQTIITRLQREQPREGMAVLIEPQLTAIGDSALLDIVLTNLLNNAWKFTGNRPDARIEFGRNGDQKSPVFFVRDNGVGFDMTYANKLFGVFQRLHKATEFSGTGIGLAIVQRIVHRHGGRVWAEAQVNQGATFHFTLGETS